MENLFIYGFLKQFPFLDEENISKVVNTFTLEVFPAKHIVLKEGDVNDKLYLVESGILREFSYKKQEENSDDTNTHWLMSEGTFIYLAESFLLDQPSRIILETLEKAKLWAITKRDLDKLYEEAPILNLIGRIMTEQNLLKYESFINMMRLSPEERFDWFDSYHKDLINRVPLKYVASYLNMTPETLSRIRTKRAKFKK